MTQDEYQKRAVALESKRDDSAGVRIPIDSLTDFICNGLELDLVKRKCFYEKKPTDEKWSEVLGQSGDVSDKLIGIFGRTFGERAARPRIVHGVLGLMTEIAEIGQNLVESLHTKECPHYGNLAEELGDLEWYMALLRDEIGVTQEQIQRQNLAKLEARYGKGQQFGGDRDIAAEQEAMKGAA